MARILIIEDHVLVRRLLWQILTDAGHEIVGEAEGGPDAATRFSALGPELVLLGLGSAGGLTTLDRIFHIEPSVPVLICAATDDLQAAREGVCRGARGFIVKPFSRDTVLSAVRHALRTPVPVHHAVRQLRPHAR